MKKQSFRIVLGRDEQGGGIAFDLATLPHLLIGGSTALWLRRTHRIQGGF